MAESIKVIQEQIKVKIASSEGIELLDILTEEQHADVTSTSKVSIWGRFVWVFAFIAWVQQVFLDRHKIDTDATIAAGQIHTRLWYRKKALAFQFGYDLIPDTDKYPEPIDFQDAQNIELSKVIKQAAIIKKGNGKLICKVATEVNDELSPVPIAEMAALKLYFEEIEDAGTDVTASTALPDDLKYTIDIYIDGLVLNTLGERLDGTSDSPVQDALKSYLKSIVFNSQLVINSSERAMLAVDGVIEVDIQLAYSRYGAHSYDAEGIQNVGIIDQFRTAESGYMKLDEVHSQFRFIVGSQTPTTNEIETYAL